VHDFSPFSLIVMCWKDSGAFNPDSHPLHKTR
jgi:hypothetical protein